MIGLHVCEVQIDFYAVMVFAEAFGVGFVVADYAAVSVAVQLLIHQTPYMAVGAKGSKAKATLSSTRTALSISDSETDSP